MIKGSETRFTKPPRLIAYTEEGGHWYRRLDDGGTFILTKDELKYFERLHINPELQMPGYDPIWSYNWKQLQLKAEETSRVDTYLNTLTGEQLTLLRDMETLYREFKTIVEEVDKMSPLEQEVWKQNNPECVDRVLKCLAWKNFGLISS